jgi:hypothetical protein
LFFAVFSFCVISHYSSVPMCLFRPKENVCLFRPEEDDVISVTSSIESASLVISNLVLLHKPIHWFRFRINTTGMPTLRSRRYWG